MRKRFKDAYGAEAVLRTQGNRFRLIVACMGKTIINRVYTTERGAKIAMGKVGDCWKEERA